MVFGMLEQPVGSVAVISKLASANAWIRFTEVSKAKRRKAVKHFRRRDTFARAFGPLRVSILTAGKVSLNHNLLSRHISPPADVNPRCSKILVGQMERDRVFFPVPGAMVFWPAESEKLDVNVIVVIRPVVREASPFESFHSSKKLCQMLPAVNLAPRWRSAL